MLLMVLQALRIGAIENFPGMGGFIARAVSDHDKLVGLERRLVPQDAVFGDAFVPDLDFGVVLIVREISWAALDGIGKA